MTRSILDKIFSVVTSSDKDAYKNSDYLSSILNDSRDPRADHSFNY